MQRTTLIRTFAAAVVLVAVSSETSTAEAQQCPRTVIRVDNDIPGSGYVERQAENWIGREYGACHGTYRYLSHTVGDGSRRGKAVWRPNITRAGWYTVVTSFRATENRTHDADYVLHSDNGEQRRRTLNQDGEGECRRENLGEIYCVPGGNCRLVLDGTDDGHSDGADLTEFTLTRCDDGAPPPVDPPPNNGGGACDGIRANGAFEVCSETANTCAGVFTNGAGCAAFCAAAGMECTGRWGGEPGCQKESDNWIGCGNANNHQSDWCECAAPANGGGGGVDPTPPPPPPTPPPPPPPPAAGLCAGIANAPNFELCGETNDSCSGVFTNGAGCAAFCAAAGMVCQSRYGGEPGCQKEWDHFIGCGNGNDHQSDWCDCVVPGAGGNNGGGNGGGNDGGGGNNGGGPQPTPGPNPEPPPDFSQTGPYLDREGAYLTYCGEPIALSGYNHYGIVAERDFDYRFFFDVLADSYGLNFVRIWGQYQWANDLMPFDGVRGNHDLTTPNEDFYRRLRDVVEYANDKGIIVQITLFDSVMLEGSSTDGNRWINSPYRNANNQQSYLDNPRDFNKTGPTAEPPVWRDVNQPYIARVVRTLCDMPNVIYEVMNEPEGSGGDAGRGTPAFVDAVIEELYAQLNQPQCTGSRLIGTNDNTMRTLDNPKVDIVAVHVPPEQTRNYRNLPKPILVSNDGDTSQVSNRHGFGDLDPNARAARVADYARRVANANTPVGRVHLEILDKDIHGASWLSQDYQPRVENRSIELLAAIEPHVRTPAFYCDQSDPEPPGGGNSGGGNSGGGNNGGGNNGGGDNGGGMGGSSGWGGGDNGGSNNGGSNNGGGNGDNGGGDNGGPIGGTPVSSDGGGEAAAVPAAAPAPCPSCSWPPCSGDAGPEPESESEPESEPEPERPRLDTLPLEPWRLERELLIPSSRPSSGASAPGASSPASGPRASSSGMSLSRGFSSVASPVFFVVAVAVGSAAKMTGLYGHRSAAQVAAFVLALAAIGSGIAFGANTVAHDRWWADRHVRTRSYVRSIVEFTAEAETLDQARCLAIMRGRKWFVRDPAFARGRVPTEDAESYCADIVQLHARFRPTLDSYAELPPDEQQARMIEAVYELRRAERSFGGWLHLFFSSGFTFFLLAGLFIAWNLIRRSPAPIDSTAFRSRFEPPPEEAARREAPAPTRRRTETWEPVSGGACARCGAAMEEERLDAVAWLECRSCGGLWFTSVGLERLLTWEYQRCLSWPAPPGPAEATSEERACVECEEPLVETTFPWSGGIALQTCAEHGIFLEPGGMRALAEKLE